MTDVRYVQGDQKYFDSSQWFAAGETDFDFNMPPMHIRSIEAGVPIKIARRRALRLLGVARQRSCQQHCRPEGQTRGRVGDE